MYTSLLSSIKAHLESSGGPPSPKRRKISHKAADQDQEPLQQRIDDNDFQFANDDAAPFGGDYDFNYMRTLVPQIVWTCVDLRYYRRYGCTHGFRKPRPSSFF